jgi:type III secretory pathway component EscU
MNLKHNILAYQGKANYKVTILELSLKFIMRSLLYEFRAIFKIGMKVTFSNSSSFKLYFGHGATYYLLPRDVAFTNPIEF